MSVEKFNKLFSYLGIFWWMLCVMSMLLGGINSLVVVNTESNIGIIHFIWWGVFGTAFGFLGSVALRWLRNTLGDMWYSAYKHQYKKTKLIDKF